MARRLLVVVGIVLLGMVAAAEGGVVHPLPTYQSPELTPWPKPRAATNGTGTVSGIGSVSISSASSSPLLQRALQRWAAVIRNSSALSPVALTAAQITSVASVKVALVVTVDSDDEALGPGTNESYTLTVDEAGAGTATAATVFGALHALASYAQLFEQQGNGLILRGLPWAIRDAPRFAHRGMLLDSARHFLPLDTLEAHIDAMASVKLNVLHWHLVDFQSFPVDSQAAPRLVQGAYSPRETYSLADLAHVVAYAKDRGVRVVPEIDTPGHSYSWHVGYPNIVTACPKTVAKGGGGQVALDPSTNETFAVVEKLLAELGGVFPDEAFHLGGDEVRFSCWNESARVRAFMAAQGMDNNFVQLEAQYENRLLQIAKRALPGKTLMVYQEVFDHNISLPTRVVFGVWKRGGAVGNTSSIPAEITKIVKAGHEVVLMNGNANNWYLNLGFGNGNVVSLWPAVYALDPLNGTTLTPQEAALVVGGEASLWGEEIDERNLAPKAWPRGAAFAERMWSPRAVNDVDEAAPRLARMFCRLAARGIRASPISPGSCSRQA